MCVFIFFIFCVLLYDIHFHNNNNNNSNNNDTKETCNGATRVDWSLRMTCISALSSQSTWPPRDVWRHRHPSSCDVTKRFINTTASLPCDLTGELNPYNDVIGITSGSFLVHDVITGIPTENLQLKTFDFVLSHYDVIDIVTGGSPVRDVTTCVPGEFPDRRTLSAMRI